MRTVRSWMDPGGSLLARRLDHLHDILQSLGARLHASVAEAIGQTVGGLVCDTVLRFFDDLSTSPPVAAPAPPPRRPERRGWGDLDRSEQRNHEADDTSFWQDEQDAQPQQDPESQPTSTSPERISVAVAAGLQMASWWLRRWSGRWRVWTTVVVVLLAVGTAYAASPLTMTALNLAGSATQLTTLSDALDSGV